MTYHAPSPHRYTDANRRHEAVTTDLKLLITAIIFAVVSCAVTLAIVFYMWRG